MGAKGNPKNIVNEAILQDIRDAVEGISYGTVTITVYQSRITQVEVAKKKRFDNVWNDPKAANP